MLSVLPMRLSRTAPQSLYQARICAAFRAKLPSGYLSGNYGVIFERMSEDQPSQSNVHRSWVERRAQAISGGEPKGRDGLVELLRDTHQRGLLEADALAMIEGVLHVAESQVRDIMIPRSQVVVLPRTDDPR